MKLFIPYDGSKSSDIALNDLWKAGLAENHQALLSITDVWLSSSPNEFSQEVSESRFKMFRAERTTFSPALIKTEEQKTLVRVAGKRILSMFPGWYLQTETLPGVTFASNEILQKSEKWKADLIILGSGSHWASENSFGTGILRVAREAKCSVRIARGKEPAEEAFQKDKAPAARIFLVLDGAADNNAEIVQAVASRSWATDSEALIVTTVGDYFNAKPERVVSSAGSFAIGVGEKKLTGYCEVQNRKSVGVLDLAEKLNANGLSVSVEDAKINSPFAIIEKARRWNADSIFINGNRSRSKESFSDLLVKVVLQQATCSIELVRRARWAAKAMRVAA